MGGSIYKDARGHWRGKGERLVWCNPASFSFKRDEMEWLLPLLSDIQEGFYIPEPGGNYSDEGIISRRIKAGAYFETLACILGEIGWRLDQLHTEKDKYLDKRLLKGSYCKGLEDFELAETARISVEKVGRRINRALNYISGTWRKNRTYEEFVSHPMQARSACVKAKQGT